MIVRYDLNALQRWNRGELQVEVRVQGHDRPVAYCDGTEDDVRALEHIAEAEGTELPVIHRRVLKTGRQIWTIGDSADGSEDALT